ncbi:MAG: GH32 C-terminal domain-containing protein [Bacteroidales bacterium]|jgi:fructan beta-fructosidase|nr:GH32 C-terminal domain-containing protein [Bacteroidales bacterium]
MRRISSILLITGSLLLSFSCNNTTVIDDFEDGSFGKWVVEGSAFSHTPATRTLDANISGYKGSYFVASKNHGTTINGFLTSSAFEIKKDYINFLLGGTSSSTAYVELLVEGENIVTSRPLGDDPNVLKWMSWDVSNYKGSKANIRIYAEFNEQRKGIIMLDHIEMSNRAKSTCLDLYSFSVHASKKWLLIPAEDGGESSMLSIFYGDKNILTVPQKISPARNKIDYYIPVDISNLIGEKLNIQITRVKKDDAVWGKIGQSDKYVFSYDEPHRQLWHMTPLYGWTNDPNGMVYHNGEFHLAYQFNPYGTRHNNMHWGHAISKNLVEWENRPFIIAPDSLGSIFSGSSVVDSENTAGFGNNAIVAIYTSAGGDNYELQQQSIAYSNDDGRSYTKYGMNPVLSDREHIDFRDPKVAWIKDQWVMSLATGQSITFYGSPDLKNWKKLSEFGKGIGSHDGVWECPDLIKVRYKDQDKWVLLVSINPGGPHGGSATQYFIGHFDGQHFIADNLDYPLWLDAGADNYAGVTFSNTPGRHIFMGWMSNWMYSNDVPTRFFRNSMTMPRELFLTHNGAKMVLGNRPVAEIYDAFTLVKEEKNIDFSGFALPDPILTENNGAFRIDFTLIPEQEGKFGFALLNDNNEKALFIIDDKSNTISLDRSESGLVSFHPDFSKAPITSPIDKQKSYKMELFIDSHSSELFVNDGIISFTNTLFPTHAYTKIQWISEDCKIRIEDIKIYTLK